MIKGFLLLTLFLSCVCYLELPVHRVPQKKGVFLDNGTCAEGTSEVCYYKDISYCVDLMNNNHVYKMAIDFTIPISWIKSPACKLSSKGNCSLVTGSLLSKIKSEIITIERKIRSKHDSDEQLPSGEIISSGNMFPVKGVVERGENIHFETTDSNKFFSIYKLFLIGVFLTDEKDQILLRNTNFINATEISDQVNKLQDGAISVRFDTESENSFLNEIFQFVGEAEKMMTVSLGEAGEVTLGDLSSKNAVDGYAGITWLPLHEKQFLMIDQITVETDGSEKVKSIESSNQAVFTLSASYISLPKALLQSLLKELNTVAKCQLVAHQFVSCSSLTKAFGKKKLIFQMLEYHISFTISELSKEESMSHTLLNIRQSESEYIIVGEPFFNKYYAAFDYLKNRIGIADRKRGLEERVLGGITLVRFVVVIFLLGIGVLACYRPTKRIIEVWNWYSDSKNNSEADAGESRRLKYSTVEISGQYDDLNSKISNVLSGPTDGDEI